MSFVVSNWEIIYNFGFVGAHICVNFGDEIDDEISLPWSQRVDTSKPTRGTSVKKYGRGQVEQTLTVGLWKVHATHAAARNYLLGHAASVPTGVSKNLRIRVKDGLTFQMPDCAIGSGDGRMITKVGVIRTWVQYKFEGGKITQI